MTRLAAAAVLLASSALAQRGSGELRLGVTDPAGLGVEAEGLLAAPALHFQVPFRTDAAGNATVRNLPFGSYRLSLSRSGFVGEVRHIEIPSAVPVGVTIALRVAALSTEVVVADVDPLIDPSRTGTAYFTGAEEIRDRRSTMPGRAVISLVDQQPGWLLEANGVLHPRGSEYGVQYVMDGIPITDYRAPAFAPEVEPEDVQAMNVMTSGYPAEFGRKLGGVIEVVPNSDRHQGTHGKVSGFGQSFATAGGYARIQQGWSRSALTLSADSARTDRYLDPPVEANYTNSGTTGGIAGRWEGDLSSSDRLRFALQDRFARFQVPNEEVQQEAGQRQDRDSHETLGTAAYTRILSPRWVFDARAMGRELRSELWSNPLSVPVDANQDRGFRELYGSAAVSGQIGVHALKAGVEGSWTSLDEAFAFSTSDPASPSTAFSFRDRRQGRESAVYLQDRVQFGAWTISAGIRHDRYSLLVAESGWSPRLGVAWHSDRAGLVLRASYDPVFQTPAFENILLASSPATRELADAGVFLPVRPSRANYFEGGFVKALFAHVRLDAKYFERRSSNFADDSVLLNTGISFPIAFQAGMVHGTEMKLDVPRWGAVSGYVSYTNMTGKARLPVAGGLFLGSDAAILDLTAGEIAITQDQRNTARSWWRAQLGPRAWVAAGAAYGSGLPVELDPADIDEAQQQYGSRILSRVNLSRGRVRPSFSLDLSGGADLLRREPVVLRLQADVLNVTNRLNVINFAGVFSGTALAPPRTAAVRISLEF